MIEALKAADELKKEDIYIRVMDPFTLKPVDKAGIIVHAKAVGGKILTVEDHYIEGNFVLTATESVQIVTFWKYFRRIYTREVGSTLQSSWKF